MSTSGFIVEHSRVDPTNLNLGKEIIISSDPAYVASCLPSNNNASGLARYSSSASSSSSSSSQRPPSISSQSMYAFNQRKSQPTATNEVTPIIGNNERTTRNYQSTEGSRNREPGVGDESTKDSEPAATGTDDHVSKGKSTVKHVCSWYSQMADKFGSLELENKGSVARDHLALERTFLAWLRTSLAFASIGIAITQLFRLTGAETKSHNADGIVAFSPLFSPSMYDPTDMAAAYSPNQLRSIGKPLGATFIGVAILILYIGFRRYFESQYWIIKGKFPASRGSVAFIAFVAAALIITALVVILAVSPGAVET